MIMKYNNKGIALFISLALLLLLSVGAVVVLVVAYNYSIITENHIKRTQALSAAESGVHYAYWKIRIGKDDSNNDVDFGDGTKHTLTPPITLPTGWTIQVDVQDIGITGRKTIDSKITY